MSANSQSGTQTDEEAKKKAEEEAAAKKKADEEAKKKAEKEAKKKQEPIRTVCLVKRYINNILYVPGKPGPVFYGAIPDDLASSFEKV
ncbi:MAG: hypothetical protein LUC93_05650 [Planctomycetaceae bacterium]|nr:hypothetical protein [Planctomycetaceae bacterium]